VGDASVEGEVVYGVRVRYLEDEDEAYAAETFGFAVCCEGWCG
jgi:hypothetical protein